LIRLWIISDTYVKGTVYIDRETNEASFSQGVMDREHGTAYGYYDNSMNETGLAVLEIQARQPAASAAAAADTVRDNRRLMYAAGYLEGTLTARSDPGNEVN